MVAIRRKNRSLKVVKSFAKKTKKSDLMEIYRADFLEALATLVHSWEKLKNQPPPQLKQKNLDADYVNTLTDAAIALKNTTPEIIFLDNHLPDGLGMNFIEYIKSHYPSIKIVMITAHDTAADRQRALSEGADYFISKPFTRDMIYKTVEQLLN